MMRRCSDFRKVTKTQRLFTIAIIIYLILLAKACIALYLSFFGVL